MTVDPPARPRFGFDTDFQAALPFRVQEVPRVGHLSRAEFRRRFQAPGMPVVLEQEMGRWAAVEGWRDPRWLAGRIPHDRPVYCRQRADPSRKYAEDYVKTTFGQLIDDVFASESTPHYLTQGLVYRARGFNRLLARERFPAFLEELADDCALPDVIDPETLHQGVLWMGQGGQVTPLHFDEQENLNGMVVGRKRWLLFPRSEAKNLLLPEHDGQGSILSSLEMLTKDGTWLGGDVQSAYYCETAPGQMLYVPAGYLHQVYSAVEPNVAVNFWYVDANRLPMIARSLRARATRRFGFRTRLKVAAQMGLLLSAILPMRVSYVWAKRRVKEPKYELGPPSYTTARGL